MNDKNNPVTCNWTDTDSDLENKAHQAKDAVFMIDDFAPSVNQQEAERIFSALDNQAGRRDANMKGGAQ